MKTKTIELQITNETGHQTLQMEPLQMSEVITKHPNHWVFIDDQLVGKERIASVNWDGVLNVRLMPALVGGSGASPRVLFIGLGGIGSSIIEMICPAIVNCELTAELSLMDGDEVSEENLAFQRFDEVDVGRSKVEVLTERFHRPQAGLLLLPLVGDLRVADQLESQDLVVVAVDRPEPRRLVHSLDTPWLDVRCMGDSWLMLDHSTHHRVREMLTPDHQPASCQFEQALENSNIQFGFAIAAAHASQWIMQWLRARHGHVACIPEQSMGSISFGTLPFPRLEQVKA